MSAHPRIEALLPQPDFPTARVRRGLVAPPASAVWRLSTFAGRFGEISGSHASAALTLAFRLVLEAQRLGEPVAWISGTSSTFYPPDVAETAVDLAALVVVRVADGPPAARAADRLVRSGAFGLVVLDLGENARVPPPVQTRLVGLAKKHHTALVCLTEKDREHPSIGSLVSIRAEALRAHQNESHFLCRAVVLKDKRRGPGWNHTEIRHGPDGLR